MHILPPQVKQHDVLFLLTVRPPSGADVAAMTHEAGGAPPAVREKYGLVSVRGCEVSCTPYPL
jgi:intron-binding protein aquarius